MVRNRFLNVPLRLRLSPIGRTPAGRLVALPLRPANLDIVPPFAAGGDTGAGAPAPWQQGDTPAAGAFNARSATTPFGNYLLGPVTATNSFGAVTGFAGSRPAGVPATMAATSGLFVLTPTATGVGFAPAAPIRTGITRDYYWNNNAYRVIQPKTARTNVHAAAELDLNDRVTAFADFTLYRAHSVTYL